MADTHSKLLINESPLTVLPSLVQRVGMEKAIILQQIQYLLQQKRSGVVLDDGEKYIWNTAKEFAAEYFSFWTDDTIRKHLKELENKMLLIARQPKLKQGDATRYYRINYDALNALIASQPERKKRGKKADHSENNAAPIRNIMPDAIRKTMPHHSEYNAASDSEYNAGSLKEQRLPKTSAKRGENAEAAPPAQSDEPKTLPNNQAALPASVPPENEIVGATEAAMGVALSNDAADRVKSVVPPPLKGEWVDLVKNRMVGKRGAAQNYLESRLGFWLGDFQKDFKFELKQMKKGREPSPPTVTLSDIDRMEQEALKGIGLAR